MTRARRERGRGWTRVAGWVLLLLGALLLVSWRQSRGLALEEAVRALEVERGILEAERVELSRRVEELRGRTRVVRVARERLGLHLPEAAEIVFVPVDRDPADLGGGT